MEGYNFIYGPIPSRRLGRSLGISPIPKKTCNYSCVYCQLGRTSKMTNSRQAFFPLAEILDEFALYVQKNTDFDVVSLVGEGEPTLYLHLGELIRGLKLLTVKPVVVITNGALLEDPGVRDELADADIVLPSLDAYDETSFKLINRPVATIRYDDVLVGLKKFADAYKGKLWLEIMLLKDINDHQEAVEFYKSFLQEVRHDKLYLNTPVRPPAEKYIEPVSHKKMKAIADCLGGIPIDYLAEGAFLSDEIDDYQAILSLIRRHPMNQHEIKIFLDSRKVEQSDLVFARLERDAKVEIIDYKGLRTFRLN